MAKRGRPVKYTNEFEKPLSVGFRIPPLLHKELLVYAYRRKTTISNVLLESVQEFLKK